MAHLFVVVKDDPELEKVPGGQNLDEYILIGPNFISASLEEGGGIGLGLLHVDPIRFVSIGGQ